MTSLKVVFVVTEVVITYVYQKHEIWTLVISEILIRDSPNLYPNDSGHYFTTCTSNYR